MLHIFENFTLYMRFCSYQGTGFHVVVFFTTDLQEGLLHNHSVVLAEYTAVDVDTAYKIFLVMAEIVRSGTA